MVDPPFRPLWHRQGLRTSVPWSSFNQRRNEPFGFGVMMQSPVLYCVENHSIIVGPSVRPLNRPTGKSPKVLDLATWEVTHVHVPIQHDYEIKHEDCPAVPYQVTSMCKGSILEPPSSLDTSIPHLTKYSL